MEEIDRSVGAVLDAVAPVGATENTFVVVTSDNGPWLTMGLHGGSAGPLRDGKGTTFEGAMQVPAIFSMPAQIGPGARYAIGSQLDLLATIAAITGAAAPKDRPLDGTDLSGVLFADGAGANDPREVVYYHDGPELYAVRHGRYEVHFVTPGNWDDPAPPRTEHDPAPLYDVQADPGERTDIAASHSEIVTQITARARTHVASVPHAPSQMEARIDGFAE